MEGTAVPGANPFHYREGRRLRRLSEPVPEVVGTATTGTMPASSTRVHQSSRSSKSQMGRVWPTMSAVAFPVSRALPPPKVSVTALLQNSA